MVDVSIVIVCMNNLKNLYPCLESIKKYTHKVTYETFVVAYFFSKDNFQMVKLDFPWVTFIESNEIRGFSENNNLALKQTKGKYCLVLNDDTEMKMPVIDSLVADFYKLPNKVAIVSPVPILPNGQVQFCGRPPHNWWKFILGELRLYNEKNTHKYCNKEGLFKSYNIIGAVFLIKTDVFRKVGWFDEYYFFSPEDIDLSTKLNILGYECWVDSGISILHYEGMTGKNRRGPSRIQSSTMPACAKGNAYFYSGNRKSGFFYNLFCLFIFVESIFFYLFYRIKSCFYKNDNLYKIWAIGKKRICYTIFSKKTPKQLFSYYYGLDKNI